MSTEKGYTEHLNCSTETKNLILDNCIQEFLNNHDEFKGINITHNFILRRIAEYYLKH